MNNDNPGPMTLFRIFVGGVNERESFRAVLDEFLINYGYIVYFGEGHWKGQKEGTAVIEVYAREAFRDTAQTLATKLQTVFNQKVVAMAEHNTMVGFYYVD